jgi:hypothetical protein
MSAAMTPSLKRLALAALLAAAPALARADGNGTSGADFLKIGMGARPAAMGGAYGAVADDADATRWNPAGLALLDRNEIDVMHLAYLADISYESVAVGGPLSRLSGWGLSLDYLWQPPFDSTNNDFGQPTDSAGTGYDFAAGASYGYNFGNYHTSDFNISNISGGVTLRVVQEMLSGVKADALYGDVGMVAEIFDGFRAALVVQNLGTTITFVSVAAPPPTNAKLGLAWKMHINDTNSLLLAYDVNHQIDMTDTDYQSWYQDLGLEYTLFNLLSLRGGWGFGTALGGLTAGAGFHWQGMGLDYAFVPYGDLGYTHRVSLSYQFGGTMARPDVAAPDAPTGLRGISGDQLVSLSWDKSPEKDVIGYNVYYSGVSGKDYVRTNEKPELNKTSLEVRLTNDKDYYFVVTAVNAGGKESEYSAEITLRPHAPSRPAAPRALKTEVQGRTVTLTWHGVEDAQVVGYNVYFTKEPGKNYRKLTKAAPLTDPECRLRGLNAGSSYYFVITSVTKDGLESEYSGEGFARPQEDTLENSTSGPIRPAQKKTPIPVDNDPI